MKKHLMTMTATAGFVFAGLGGQVSASEKNYQVSAGDTLWKISVSQQVSVQNLIAWNQLSNSTIYPGQTLSLVDPNSQQNVGANYIVKSGDSLWSIASKNGISVQLLMSYNQLTSNTIYVGQKLKLSGASTSSIVSSEGTTYTVKSGDTLWNIATRHGITVASLKAMNNMTADTIYVGQVLNIKSPLKSTIDSKVLQIITEAKKHIGVPYVWGGTSPAGFDCSGFIHYSFLKAGVSIPRTVETIWAAAKTVAAPKVGDLVFFETYKKGPSHAGIYLGNNEFIHAGSSTGVTISSMNSTYWKPRYLGAKTPF
ncbi:peptidoglycan endopeptidase [Bacillus mesophilum]|uniref:LysM peptidoglycan-binding domain-containing protein n=1 Tax=Bacillus mesophilum TaxID=1071718 RepID=A0A7V7UXA8_9BACI|nr:peptidoglycan endopeptidase [Bacillus mesophilum]KAB2335681.1 LysM peptidoglycan-binding domain-containing protein [Bacillus mesophilum]